MTVKTAFVVLAALTSAAAVGCASGSSDQSKPDPGGDQTKASLHRAKGCDDLLGDLKADAKWKLNHSIDLQIQNIKACQAHYPDAQCASYGYAAPHGSLIAGRAEDSSFGEATNAPTSANAGGAAPAASPSDSSGSGSGKSAQSASSFSQTNTQVKGVDEADIVKNDGTNIYVLHGNAFKVIHAFPASQMKESGSIAIDGTPTEMFVADGKVVVYSQVNGADVLNAAGIKPRSQYQDYGYAVAYAGTAAPTAADDANVAPTPKDPNGTTPAQPQVYVPLTKVTVLTLNGDTPVVTRESWFEGSYLDSRRVGSSVRTVYQGNAYGPALKYNIYDGAYPVATTTPACGPNEKCATPDPAPTNPYPQTGTDSIAALEKLRGVNTALIDASVIADWLPYTFVRANGGVSATTTSCGDFYVPTVGSTESGITEVSTIDLNDPSGAPRETAILGRADTVYGNADSLYVAARAYVEPPFVWYDTYAGGGTAVSTPPSSGTDGGSAGTGTAPGSTEPSPPAPTPKPIGGIGTESLHLNADPNGTTPAILSWSSDNTHVHKFEFTSDPKFGNYVASGTVRGAVKDQFSLDEKDGFLRIATTEYRNYYTTDGVWAQADSAPVAKGGAVPARPQQVSHVFVLGQTGAYLGQQGDAGDLAPNEQIYSVRFVDNRGYVVTYRQVDPLFVLDLATPQKPTVVGELTIPGFSEYMHPLDANHLLTIGRNDQSQLALSIFDVSNPAAPNRTFNLAYTGGDYSSSTAEYDHKAFTYFADKGLLAIPFYSYGYAKSDSYGMHSSLEIFKIDVNAGITHLGDVDGTALVSQYKNGYCGGYYSPEVRRGVFLDTTVYAISYGGIAAKDVNNLGAAPTTFPLPYPQANDYYGGAIPTCVPVPETGTVDPQPEPKK